MSFGLTSSQIAEEMFGSKPTAYIRSPVGSGDKRRVRPASTPEAVIGNAMLMHQAMIKVVRDGGIKEKGALSKQLSYISRKGKLEIERGTGDEERDQVQSQEDLIKDWEADFARADPRMTFFTYHMIVSYPRETDDAAARVASEEFAARLAGGEHGDRYKYVIAHHRDTNNPHAHILINRIGEEGRTLQINRQSISTDHLRRMHVETARSVGINLNATSRFSRGVEERSVALGRIKAEKEGRGLAQRAQPMKAMGFPFYGAGHREDIDALVLREAKLQNIRNYQIVANSLKAIASKANLPVVDLIGHSINSLKQGKELKWSEQMATNDVITLQKPQGDGPGAVQEKAREEFIAPQNPVDVLDDVNKDIRTFFEGMMAKVEKIPEEDRRSEAEGALSRALQQYQPLMDEGNRERFGRFFVEEDRTARENSPEFQRSEAVRDIRDNRTDDLAADRSTKSDREVKGQERLSQADQAVVDRFAKIGFSGDLAMDRIRNGSTVDRETRQQWFDRDVKTHANTNSLSEKQARADLKAAYGDAADIYKEARQDIRNINRADIGQTRTEQVPPARVDQTDQAKDRTQQRPVAPVTARAEDRPQNRQDERQQGRGPASDAPFSVTGVIKEIGEKLYRANDPRSSSPYITVTQDNGKDRDVFGVAMPDVVERYRLKEGDRATLTNIGKETVEVKQTDPATGEQRSVMAERRAWEASNIERAKRPDREDARTDKRTDRDEDRGVSR